MTVEPRSIAAKAIFLRLFLGFVLASLSVVSTVLVADPVAAAPRLALAHSYGAAMPTYDTSVRFLDARDVVQVEAADRDATAVSLPRQSGAVSQRFAAVSGFGVAANSGSRIAANQAAGNAARDVLAASHPGSLIEQSLSTTAGVRRLDVLTQGGLGIESKVGRTSLTAATRSQIAKDSLLLRNGDVTGMEWVFSRSGVTGQIGPTGPLGGALGKAGIPWSLAP